MKKNLLFAALVIPLLSVSAQWTQTGGTVKVMPNTLKYVTGNHNIQGTAIESNEGNVNVRGDFAVGTTATFRNEFTDAQAYGQLIIQNGQTVAGEIVSEYALNDISPFFYMSFPFLTYTAETAANQAGLENANWFNYTGTGNFYSQRYKNPIFSHNNESNYSEDRVASEILEVTKSHSINIGYAENDTATLDQVLEFKGTPNNLTANESVSVPSTIDIPSSKAQNSVGEWFYSYIFDPVVAAPVGWKEGITDVTNEGNYGENVYYFGNPYTSAVNIQSFIESQDNIAAVFIDMEQAWNPEVGNVWGENNNYIVKTTDGTGDGDEIYLIRPHHQIGIKADATTPVNFALFPEESKTFAGDLDGEVAPNYGQLLNNRNFTPFYQIGMHLYDSNDMRTGNRFYVVASDAYQAANSGEGIETFNNWMEDDATGFYTLQENADGTISTEYAHAKAYINGVNATDYIALPIQLAFQAPEGGTFTLKPVFSDALSNSDHMFYFEDTQEGEIFEIDENFSYTFTTEGNELDRFRMYWNGVPEQLSVDEVSLVSETVVYKDSQIFKVRFAKDWNKADVYVYNVMGQLVHSATQVDTSTDYVLPLRKQAAVYVVKTVGDNGTVTTKKIVTK